MLISRIFKPLSIRHTVAMEDIPMLDMVMEVMAMVGTRSMDMLDIHTDIRTRSDFSKDFRPII